MNLGIIAHNSKKVLIEDFCIAYKNILAKHEVYAQKNFCQSSFYCFYYFATKFTILFGT